MSLQAAGISAAPRTPYQPSTGDLVFFEYQPDHVASTLVAVLDWPHHGDLAVSHVGIVDARTTPVTVIENNLDTPDGVKRSLLQTACNPPDSAPRCMLTIPQPDPSLGTAVLDKATNMLTFSDYSKMQLGLAGLAAILRRMPCTWLRRQHWEIVHECSRTIESHADTVRRGAASHQHYFLGTCVGMVAEAQTLAGADLRVVEPDCPDPEESKSMAYYISVLADRIANVMMNSLDDLNDDAARVRDSIGAIPSVETPDSGDSQVIPTDAVDPGDPTLIAFPGERVFFGPRAAIDLVKELLRLEMVVFGTELKLLGDLHITFSILDALIHAVRGTSDAPQPGEPVYRPLMSLGLILDQLGPPGGPYRPYPKPAFG